MSNSKLVLSYNICFQAMCNDNFGSAAPLGESCVWIIEDELTICAQNMANFMDGAPHSVGHTNFDFVGLQEANNVQYLQPEANNTLAKLAMIKSKTHATHHGHNMHMASFYDATKYNLIEDYTGAFNSYKTDRPFHILILEEISNSQKIIFINVHAPHGSSENTKHHSYYSSFEAVSYDLSEAAKQMRSFDPSENYEIIMTGDFNETGWDWSKRDLNTMKWNPFSFTNLDINVEISNIIFSCSKPSGCWHSEDGDRGGDYIFASSNPAKIIVPKNYVFAPYGACNDFQKMKSIWQSDHLPVMSIVN